MLMDCRDQAEGASLPASQSQGSHLRHQDSANYWRMMRTAANTLWHKTRRQFGPIVPTPLCSLTAWSSLPKMGGLELCILV